MMMKFDEKRTRRRIDRITRLGNVRRILHDLGIEYTEKRHGDLWIKCPIAIHKDKDASAHICATLGDANHGIWNCFGCETSGDLVEIIRQHLGLTFSESILWAEARVHAEEDVVYRLDKEKKPPPALPEHYESPEDPSDWDMEYMQYLQDRSIPWYQIVQYGLGYCRRGKYTGRIIVPVMLGSEFRTWIGRNVRNKGQRVTSCDGGFPGLFGSQFANPTHGPAILTEGWTDTLRVEGAGYPNVMALQTNRIHEDQIKFLEPYEYIVVMPDGDDGGDRLVNALSVYLHRQEFFIARVPEGLDPDDASNDQIDKAIEKMKPWKPVVRRTEIEIIY